MSDAAEERTVPVDPGVGVGTPIWLVVEGEGGPCAVAVGRAVEGGVAVGPVGAARAAWLGEKVRPSETEVGACFGLPPVDALVIPPTGAAVGVRGVVGSTDVAGPFAVTEIGGGWWEVRPTGFGSGTVVFRHPGDPPTSFEVAADPRAPSPPGTTLRIAVGGVVVRPDAPVTFVDLGPNPVATVIAVGTSTVVLGTAGGVADGLWRVGDGTPEPLHVEVAGGIAAGGDAVVVPVGGHRTRKPDRPVTTALVADARIARVVVDGARVRFDGLAPGRTEVVLEGPDGLHVLAVSVGY